MCIHRNTLSWLPVTCKHDRPMSIGKAGEHCCRLKMLQFLSFQLLGYTYLTQYGWVVVQYQTAKTLLKTIWHNTPKLGPWHSIKLLWKPWFMKYRRPSEISPVKKTSLQIAQSILAIFQLATKFCSTCWLMAIVTVAAAAATFIHNTDDAIEIQIYLFVHEYKSLFL